MRNFVNNFSAVLDLLLISECLTLTPFELEPEQTLEVPNGSVLVATSDDKYAAIAFNATTHPLRVRVAKHSRAKKQPDPVSYDLQPMTAVEPGGRPFAILVSDTGLVYNVETRQPLGFTNKYLMISWEPIPSAETIRKCEPWALPVPAIHVYNLSGMIDNIVQIDPRAFAALTVSDKPLTPVTVATALSRYGNAHDIRIIRDLFTVGHVYVVQNDRICKTDFSGQNQDMDIEDLKNLLDHLPSRIYRQIDFGAIGLGLEGYSPTEINCIISVLVCASVRWSNHLGLSARINEFDFSKNRTSGLSSLVEHVLNQPLQGPPLNAMGIQQNLPVPGQGFPGVPPTMMPPAGTPYPMPGMYGLPAR